MIKSLFRRCLRSAGWWLADGMAQRLGTRPAADQITRRFTGDHEARNTDDLERIRIHTWLSKEFEAMAFEDRLLEAQLRKFGPAFVAKYNAHMFSQTYEDSAIAEIFSRIGSPAKTFVEIGVEDGSENTTRFLLMLGWRGLWIEGNGDHCDAIRRGFKAEIASGQLQIIHAMAEPDTVQSLIGSAGFGDTVDLLSVDVDQHTSHLFRAITTRPRAACIEYNAHIPPTVDYEVPYRGNTVWDHSNWFGASLKAMERIGAEKGLSLVGCDLAGVNAYFVDATLTRDLFAAPFTAEHHFQPPRFPFVRGTRGHQRRAVPSRAG